MYVLASITGTLTVTFPDDTQETYTFTQTYGKRSGKTTQVTCSATFSHTHDGVSETGPMSFTHMKIW